MDAPEFDRDGERAVVAMQFLAQLLSRAARVQAVVQRSHPDLYGRWIVELYADGRNVAEVMIAAGYAVRYEDRVVRKGPFSPAVAGRMSHGG
jgi:endonuclease YncB( thermonuclease family)